MQSTPTLPPPADPTPCWPPVAVSPRNAPLDWPFGELTQEQRLTRAKQEARMRAGTLRGLPSCFGELA